jgi:hypothetical protein
MPVPVSSSPGGASAVGRPLVASLFVASALLSVVSWYTTQQGMALYLAPWFALLASLGVQSTLVIVAWLVGLTGARRGPLLFVYSVTAVVSIAFSYVSLHTWFASRERPAEVQRGLYDELSALRRRRTLAGARGRSRRRGPEARAGARGDGTGGEGARIHLAGDGRRPVPGPSARVRRARGAELRQRIPRG